MLRIVGCELQDGNIFDDVRRLSKLFAQIRRIEAVGETGGLASAPSVNDDVMEPISLREDFEHARRAFGCDFKDPIEDIEWDFIYRSVGHSLDFCRVRLV